MVVFIKIFKGQISIKNLKIRYFMRINKEELAIERTKSFIRYL